MPVCIEIDDREASRSGIGEVLAREHSLEVRVRRMGIGDFVINGRVAAERKRTRDFVTSIIDGRLFVQAAGLKWFPGPSFMIVEGEDVLETGLDVSRQAVQGALLSLAVSWQLPVVFSIDLRDTARILVGAAWQDFSRVEAYGKRHGRKPRSFEKLQLYVLQGLPGVGRSTAVKLLEHFGSVEAAVTAPEEALRLVRGIGEGRAAGIREVITGRGEWRQEAMDFETDGGGGGEANF